MRRITPSIRTQLLCWLVIPILVLLIVGAAFSYGLAMNLATDAYDKGLVDSVHTIARCVVVKDGKIVLDMPPAALEILRDDPRDKVFYQVLDSDLNLIAGDAQMPRAHIVSRHFNETSDCRDDTINGEQIRIAVVKVHLPGDPKTSIYIQVGETTHAREKIADQILVSVIVPQFVILALSALLVWFGVKKGLAPLRSVKDAVASRGTSDLRPLAVMHVPKEVRPLVSAINELLSRLDDDMEAQRRFVANAAHQLRTPIAGLKTQTEVALRQTDPAEVRHALGLIRTGAERATRLANQLLALARAEPGAADRQRWREVDLNTLGRTACYEFVSFALSKNIDLGFEMAVERPLIVGDESSLHELACNLIHNALQYTESGGKVTVRTEPSLAGGAHGFKLIVEDNGPGIPKEERERVFERFYRVIDRQVSGSGLGLAIVQEIAHLHEAEVAIEDGQGGAGTRVCVLFKAPAPAVQPRKIAVKQAPVAKPEPLVGAKF